MQTTSATYDRILAGTDFIYEAQLIIDGVGTYGESDIISISTNIEMFQEDPEVGKAISAEINVSMFNPSATIPTMAKIRPQVRACGTAPKSSKVTITDEDLASEYASYSSENITFSPESGATVVAETLSFAVDSSEYLESEWIAQGVYFIDTREVTQNNNGLDVLSLHGFDAMLKTEQMYSSNSTVGDNLDVAYVRSIASAIGVSVDPRTWEIMQTGYMIPFPLGYSMREILGYIASAYAGCFIISDTGQLRLVALEDIESETRYLIDEIGNIIVFGVDSPEHTVTASGAVATFSAGGEYDLDELEIAIDPVQDLHGYDSPWPAGGGKNKLKMTVSSLKTTNIIGSWSGNSYVLNGITFTINTDSDGNVTGISATGTASSNADFYYIGSRSDVYADAGIESGSYILSGNPTSGGEASTYVVEYGGTIVGQQYDTTEKPVTVDSTKTYRIFTRINSGKNPDGAIFKTMIRASNISDATFAPYENNCPISGHTGATVYQSNNEPVTEYIEGSYYTDNGGTTQSIYMQLEVEYIPVESGAVYAFKFASTGSRKLRVHEYDANKTWLRQIINENVSTTTISYTASNDAKYIRYSYPIECGTLNLCLASYQITWQDEAGTVYKGTLNVKTGVLTATHASKTFTSSSDISKISTTAWYIEASKIPSVKNPSSGEATVMSDKFKPAYPATAGGCFLNTGGAIRFNTTVEYSDSSALMTALGSIQFVYPLNSALTFQLTPTQVKTLLGQNNLWANTGNVINLEFTEPATEAVRILV